MRAQAYTLEAFTAALLLLASVAFAMQVTAVTPLTASTSSQHIENQQASTADGILATAAANGSLKRQLLYWNATAGRFHGAGDEGYYETEAPPTELGRTLSETFSRRGIAYNLNVYHLQTEGEREKQEVIHFGEPSDNAVSATRTVTLSDDARLYEANASEGAVVSEDTFYAEDASEGPVYNVLVVEVVVWRM